MGDRFLYPRHERLKEVSPGLIDHREWTDANGRNNALRINGWARRGRFKQLCSGKSAFPMSVMEKIMPSPCVCRGSTESDRIYENLYWSGRWAVTRTRPFY